jgi:hypothetical protein
MTPTIREHIDALKPTQISVGMQQVRVKAAKLDKMSKNERRSFLEMRPVPCIKGPEEALYIIDHHHLCCAAKAIGEKKIFVTIIQDWSQLSENVFWQSMYDHHYLWPYDEYGNRIELAKMALMLPRSIELMKNDPYRAMAGLLRKQGVYEKDWTPFSEFKWANKLREHLALRADQETFTDAEIQQGRFTFDCLGKAHHEEKVM